MKPTKTMQNLLRLILLVPLLLAISCSEENEVDEVTPDSDIIQFEKKFTESLSYKSGETVKLIGYKTLKLSAEEAKEFYAQSKTILDENKNYFLDKEKGELRMYFPVEGALIDHRGSMVEASSVGELNLTMNDVKETDMAVLGRKQTETVLGVETNIVKDGIIYLSKRQEPDHTFNSVFVYNFGEKVIMDHSQHGRVADDKASCMTNHGSWRNCSTAFGIRNGRCTFNKNVCMDYNGWFTNCKNGKTSNFPGSDCASAMARGHCWNEVM